MVNIKGVNGKLLRVDLENKKTAVEEIPEEIYTKYLGGRGAGARYLSDEVSPDTEPFSKENKLIFFTGTMTSTMAPGNNKTCVTFKSPATNGYAFSLVGGHLGPELKFAGYDALIVEGKADKPVYLWIENDDVKIKDAEGFWGEDIPTTGEGLKKELGGDENIRVACIGEAGENLNVMACITSERHREFGRPGSGAVMGSKNLKAIAVRGTKDISPAKAPKMAKYVEELHKEFKTNPKADVRKNYGTPEMVHGINKMGFWSTRNFTEGEFEEAAGLEGPAMREQIVVEDTSCYACPIGCGKVSCIKSEKYGTVHIEGPEFETIGLVGANCGVGDWEYLLKATEVCDYNGMDTMSTGATVAMAMECYEKGIITEKDTDGIDLRFGNGEALVEVLKKTAKREGIGDILAKGVKAAAEEFGAEELAVHSKGVPFATYDPRGCKGMAVTYATSPKGAHHMVSPTMGGEIGGGTRLEDEGKAGLVRDTQIQMAVVDSLGYCATMRPVMKVNHQYDLYKLNTGVEDMTQEEFYQVGERILNLERMYNNSCGMTRKDDSIPKRFKEEGMKEGASKGETINLDKMLDEFYAEMNWTKDGEPTDEKLQELGLK